MKKYLIPLALLLAVAVLFTAAWAAAPFEDVSEGDWYAAAVDYVYEKGLMNGITETTFEPNSTMTRAMLVTVLGRMKGVDVTNYESAPFTDVPDGLWFTPYVAWAAENGVVNGMPDNTFHPLDNVTRQDAACMIARYIRTLDAALEESGSTDFPDAADIAPYALESVGFMSRTGLIRGDNHGNFNPQNNITRAEAATILMRLDQKLAEAPATEDSTEPSTEESTEPSTEESTEPPIPDWIETIDSDTDSEGWSERIS